MLHTPVRRNAGSEEGFALMEVVVSAAVLIIVVLGVLAAVDSVSRTASANQGRTVASTLAEKELERLRSLRTSDLNKLAQIESDTQTILVGETTWKIVSKAVWVNDSTGEDISCALTGDKGSYMRITASVVPASAPAGTQPLVMTSIVAPQPGKGTLTGLVRGATGAPIIGLPVQAIGPSPATKATNDAGCAVFDESEAGSYTLRLNSSGWVDPDGNQLREKNGTVSAGNLTTVEFLYDRAGSFPVNVVTRRVGETIYRPDRSNGVMAAHTGVSSGHRAMAVTGTGSTSFTFTSMFPFVTPYEVYSGACTANNPATFTGLEAWFADHAGAVAKVDPATVGPARTVLEPAIDVTVRYRSTTTGTFSPASGAFVYAYPRTPDCSTTARVTLGTTGTDGKVPLDNTGSGPGLPFGVYDLCVSLGTRRLNISAVSNTNENGTPIAADIRNTDATGVSCA